MNCGWGYYGFKSCAAAGKYMAQFMANGSCPSILKPFTLRRYEQHRLMGEIATPISYTPWN
jgi:sarcosine oxidase subunit beta